MHEDPAGFLIDLALGTANQIHSVTQAPVLECVDCGELTACNRLCLRCGGGLVQVIPEKGEGHDG